MVNVKHSGPFIIDIKDTCLQFSRLCLCVVRNSETELKILGDADFKVKGKETTVTTMEYMQHVQIVFVRFLSTANHRLE